jgi:CRP/FNR family transcriptional regulator, cyclic AMP receptor protein
MYGDYASIGGSVLSKGKMRAPGTGKKKIGSPSFNPEVFLATAGVGRKVVKYAKKKVIFAQGEDADAVFYITKGRVKVAVVSSDGKEAVVALLGADEFVGEGCLLGQPKRLATASAMSECETMRVEKAEIQRVLHDELAFAQMFVSHILARNARVRRLSGSTVQFH